jgi:hypothetical protein
VVCCFIDPIEDQVICFLRLVLWHCVTGVSNSGKGESITFLNVPNDLSVEEVGSPLAADLPSEFTDPSHGANCGHHSIDVTAEFKHAILVL